MRGLVQVIHTHREKRGRRVDRSRNARLGMNVYERNWNWGEEGSSDEIEEKRGVWYECYSR